MPQLVTDHIFGPGRIPVLWCLGCDGFPRGYRCDDFDPRGYDEGIIQPFLPSNLVCIDCGWSLGGYEIDPRDYWRYQYGFIDRPGNIPEPRERVEIDMNSGGYVKYRGSKVVERYYM